MKFKEEECMECKGSGLGQMLCVDTNTGEKRRVCSVCFGDGYLIQPEEE